MKPTQSRNLAIIHGTQSISMRGGAVTNAQLAWSTPLSPRVQSLQSPLEARERAHSIALRNAKTKGCGCVSANGGFSAVGGGSGDGVVITRGGDGVPWNPVTTTDIPWIPGGTTTTTTSVPGGGVTNVVITNWVPEEVEWCGPDITSEFLAKLKIAMLALDAINTQSTGSWFRPLDKLGNAIVKEAAKLALIASFVSPGTLLDFKQPGRYSNAMCPGCSKDYSVTLCGMCVNAEVPGNFALGFLCQYGGFGDIGNAISLVAAAADTEIDEPEDQASVDAGEGAAKSAKQSQEKNKDKGKDKDKGKGKDKGKDKDSLKDAVCDALKALAASTAGIKVNCEPCTIV